MIKLISALFFTAILITGCGDRKPETVVKKDSTEKMTIKKDTAVTVRKEMKTKTGKEFVIVETKPSYSVSDYMITGVGFPNSTDTIRYSMKNPMTTAMVADLDKNGFDELYILTKATGSGSFVDILGVASVDDKTFGEIIVQEITDKDVEKNEMFSGYMGQDSVYISDNKIIREFPVYKSNDMNSKPTGGSRRITYTLKPGTQYQLVVTGRDDMK